MLDRDILIMTSLAEVLRDRAQVVIDNFKDKEFENIQAFKNLEVLNENISEYLKAIEYLKKETIEGTLNEKNDGRFEIDGTDIYFTCGSSIEVYNESLKAWNIGKVEGRSENGKGVYYFMNHDDDNMDLKNGMRVRIRK